MTVRCLTIHASYGCRRSGACCTSGWPIPIEADQLAALDAAVSDGRLQTRATAGAHWMRPVDAEPDTPARLGTDSRGCVFFDDGGERRCRIHHALGHDALPLACRQFPRVSVLDPRGASITLSHYCPTAAGLLDADRAIAIADDAPAFPSGAEYVGLDVRASLPPLLRPGMLMDWESWWAWERQAIALIGQPDRTVDEAVSRLRSAVETARGWSPARGPLLAWIERAFADANGDVWSAPPAPDRHLELVLGAVPDELRPASIDRPGPPPAHVVRGFLAAHAFANWTAHLGQGLRSWLHAIETARALLEVGLGVRQADLVLRHLSDPHALAASFSRAERA